MKHTRLPLYLIILSSLLTGCRLSAAPDCSLGQKRCENDSVLNSGIAYVCLENNTWQGLACPEGCADKTACAGVVFTPACEVEGERICESIGDVSISFICINRQWIPGVCAIGAVCDGNMCSKTQTSCTDGEQLCIDVEAIGASIALVCHNGEWISSYCQDNLQCDGNVCATKESDKDSDDCKNCDDERCIDGECMPPTCEDDKNIYMTQTALRLTNVHDESTTSYEVKTFCINSPELLYKVRDAINEGKVYPESNKDNAYILATDLNLDAANWVPIGNNKNGFDGVFMGNQKTIHLDNEDVTFTSNQIYGNKYGFFGALYGSYVDGVNLYISMNVSIDEGNVGGLAAISKNSYISNSIIYPTIKIIPPGLKKGTLYLGGVFGGNYDYTKLVNLKVLNADFNVSGTSDDITVYIGGLAGAYGGDVENCEFDGNMTGVYKAAGGLVGSGGSAVINSHSSGSVIRSGGNVYPASVGGLIGDLAGGSIENSYSSVTVRCDGRSVHCGGFIGGGGESSRVKNCYSTGNVDCGDGDGKHCGGFIGYNAGIIESSYSTGDVTCGIGSYVHCGGFIGHNEGGTVENSYSSGLVNGEGGTSFDIGGFVGMASFGTYTSCGSFGNVNGSSGSFVSSGLFAGAALDGFTIDKCFALGKISASGHTLGGFIGHVSNAMLDGTSAINYSYVLALAEFTCDEDEEGGCGDFIGEVGGDFSAQQCYYKNSFGKAMGRYNGSESWVSGEVSPVVTKSNTEGVLTTYASDGTTSLDTALGDGWTMKTCSLDIGDGVKDYIVPLSTAIYPAICH